MAKIKVLKISASEDLPDGFATTIEDARYIVGEMLGCEEDLLELRSFSIHFEIVEMDEDEFNAFEPYNEVL